MLVCVVYWYGYKIRHFRKKERKKKKNYGAGTEIQLYINKILS